MTRSPHKKSTWMCVATLGSFLLTACGYEPLTDLEAAPLSLPQKTVTIQIKDYCAQPGRRYLDMFAANHSAKIQNDEIKIDFDRDGLTNEQELTTKAEVNGELVELNLGIDPRWKDSNVDGYSDLLPSLVAMNLFNQSFLKTCLNPQQDSDQDGLNDCEEAFLGTDELDYDSDGDNLSDYLEVRNGMDPSNPVDVLHDPDGDDISSLTEIKNGTPPFETNSDYTDSLALQYDTQYKTINGQDCYDIELSNVPVVNVSNGNLIQFYFVEETGANFRELEVVSVVVPRSEQDKAVLVYQYNEMN